MTYDGNFALTKTTRVKIPDPKTIATQSLPSIGVGLPINLYKDTENVYLVSPANDKLFFASTQDPMDLYEQTQYQVAGQFNFIMNVYPNPINGAYWAFGTTDDLATPQTNIFKSDVSAPKYWYDTGADLPSANVKGCSIYADTSNVYLYGGFDGGVTNVNTIQIAPVSNPTSFVVSGNTLPGVLSYSAFAKIGSTLYLYGGNNGSTTNVIYSAPATTPSVWSNTGSTLPVAIEKAISYVNATHVYLFAQTTIYRATIGAPTAFTNVGTLPNDSNLCNIYADSNFIYIYGSSFIQYASVSNPLVWTTVTAPLATATTASQVGFHAGRIWVLGGRSSGGSAQTTIQSTESSVSTRFVNSGNVLPAALMGGTLVKTSQYFYIIGGNGITGNVYRAALTDPTTWTLAGTNGPLRTFGTCFIIGNHVYYYGGESTEGTLVAGQSGSRAVIQNGQIIDSSWQNTGPNPYFALAPPVAMARQVSFVVGNYVYITGGYVSGPTLNLNIYRASIRDLAGSSPWTSVSTLGTGVTDASVIIVNGGLYIVGGGSSVATPFNNTSRLVQYAPLSALAAGVSNTALFTSESNYIGTAIAGARIICRNEKLWLIGGRTSQNGTTTIQKSSGFTEYRPIFARMPGSLESTPAIDVESGHVGSINQLQNAGMLPWLVTNL